MAPSSRRRRALVKLRRQQSHAVAGIRLTHDGMIVAFRLLIGQVRPTSSAPQLESGNRGEQQHVAKCKVANSLAVNWSKVACLYDHLMIQGKVGVDKPAKRYLVRRSKRLPKWLWYAIACSLGVRNDSNQRGIVAALLYSLTVLSALVFIATTATYVVSSAIQSYSQIGRSSVGSNDSSPSSEGDMTEGCFMVLLTVFWCLLGFYAQGLAYRLYSSAKFIEMVRLHAKTVLKVNAAFVFFLLITSFVSVNNVHSYYVWYVDRMTCLSVGLPVIVCHLRFMAQCAFSVFAILWNSLVGIVLLSVCRTNTMGIRRFIEDLERDALIYERQRFGPGIPTSETLWLASENEADQSSEGEEDPPKAVRKCYSNVSTVTVFAPDPEPNLQGPTPILTPPNGTERTGERDSLEMSIVSPRTLLGTAPHLNGEVRDEHLQPMSNAVLLNRYWKLACAARISSLTFQRWTTCVTALCLTWVAIGLVQWLSTTPRTLQVVQVSIPILILPLLSAAYAEVNVEGKRLLKCVCPIEERLTALYFMSQSPPQMTIFGVSITYAALGTAAAGLLLALASRVVLKQLGVATN